MFIYRVKEGVLLEKDGRLQPLETLDWDRIFVEEDPIGFVLEEYRSGGSDIETGLDGFEVLAPIKSQEVWAAGVTYRRSREARREESKDAGGGDFYDLVYEAERPELFFKSTPHRTAGAGGDVRIRKDSAWNVPEPELTLAVSAGGRIFGYTIGNDMSSRDIEGENPLYLPQAKVYDGSCALGPRVYLTNETLPASTEIHMEIKRAGEKLFEGVTALSQLKQSFETLVEYLFREDRFPQGCFLMTGTGIVPPDEFTLAPGDEITISVDPIGVLTNRVAEA